MSRVYQPTRRAQGAVQAHPQYEKRVSPHLGHDFACALRGDQTIQEIASRHKVHPNQVSTWKRQAMDGLGAIFSNSSDKVRVDHEGGIHDLHAKIGELTVERDFLARGLKR